MNIQYTNKIRQIYLCVFFYAAIINCISLIIFRSILLRFYRFCFKYTESFLLLSPTVIIYTFLIGYKIEHSIFYNRTNYDEYLISIKIVEKFNKLKRTEYLISWATNANNCLNRIKF